jgi:uncharacterized damage-inducible protein DinB
MSASERQYPIGRFVRPPAPLDPHERSRLIDQLAQAPAALRALVAGLTEEQLDTPYREGGWSIRQVVHHLPDSHMNGYIRMKLAATEDRPPIRLYQEAQWAELPEARTAPIEMSLDLLDGLHQRWIAFLRSCRESDFERVFMHPDWGAVRLDAALALYAWHARHHTAHIRIALELS